MLDSSFRFLFDQEPELDRKSDYILRPQYISCPTGKLMSWDSFANLNGDTNRPYKNLRAMLRRVGLSFRAEDLQNTCGLCICCKRRDSSWENCRQTHQNCFPALNFKTIFRTCAFVWIARTSGPLRVAGIYCQGWRRIAGPHWLPQSCSSSLRLPKSRTLAEIIGKVSNSQISYSLSYHLAASRQDYCKTAYHFKFSNHKITFAIFSSQHFAKQFGRIEGFPPHDQSTSVSDTYMERGYEKLEQGQGQWHINDAISASAPETTAVIKPVHRIRFHSRHFLSTAVITWTRSAPSEIRRRNKISGWIVRRM